MTGTSRRENGISTRRKAGGRESQRKRSASAIESNTDESRSRRESWSTAASLGTDISSVSRSTRETKRAMAVSVNRHGKKNARRLLLAWKGETPAIRFVSQTSSLPRPDTAWGRLARTVLIDSIPTLRENQKWRPFHLFRAGDYTVSAPALRPKKCQNPKIRENERRGSVPVKQPPLAGNIIRAVSSCRQWGETVAVMQITLHPSGCDDGLEPMKTIRPPRRSVYRSQT